MTTEIPPVPMCSKCKSVINGVPHRKTMEDGAIMFLCNSCYSMERTTGL